MPSPGLLPARIRRRPAALCPTRRLPFSWLTPVVRVRRHHLIIIQDGDQGRKLNVPEGFDYELHKR